MKENPAVQEREPAADRHFKWGISSAHLAAALPLLPEPSAERMRRKQSR
jgi:hypothetical protein